MFVRHASVGLPLIRSRTGSGLRQPGFRALAREGLTAMKGLMPRIFTTALKVEVIIATRHDKVLHACTHIDPWTVLHDHFTSLVHVLHFRGLLQQSVEAHRRAVELDPASITSVARTLFLAGE